MPEAQRPRPVLELLVNNHPGVMSHVTGLFARRAFNLEGILCGRVGCGARSRLFLLVDEDERLEQLVLELHKLYDVLAVDLRRDLDESLFDPGRADGTPLPA